MPDPILHTLRRSTPFSSCKTPKEETYYFHFMDEEPRCTEVILFKFTLRVWESQVDYVGNLSLQLFFFKKM